jgi:hypothetical protein
MKRIRFKQPENKILLRKRITSKLSNNIPDNKQEAKGSLQVPQNTINENDSEDLQNVLLNDSQEYKTSEIFYSSESDFIITSDDEQSNANFILDETEQTMDELSDSEQSSTCETRQQNIEVIQQTVESKVNFEPLLGEYGPYFQNFTEMMLFTWVTKHMICKLNL